MLKFINLNRIWLFIIPLLVMIWSIFFLWWSGPFFITRVDPDYIYLLNGLNCVTLDFYRIAHIDHPGTPFQLLTGFFILITYVVAGQGPVVDDVITRPELYLSTASLQLSLITAFIILWLGRLVMKGGNDIIGALIIQSSLFLNVFLIDLPCRYIPDRMLVLVALVFTGFCFRYLYAGNYSARKFALHSGILLGVGFVTKFNFLPLLIIPVFLLSKWRDRFLYGGVFVVSSVISFAAVYDKFSRFKEFIISLVKHDGLYGGGSEKVFNPESFWHNFKLIFLNNMSFTIVLGLALILIIVFIFIPAVRKRNPKALSFFLSMMAVTLIGSIMTAKHFKEYYMLPVVSLTGLSLLVAYKSFEKVIVPRLLKPISILVLIGLILIPVTYLYRPYLTKQQRHYSDVMTAEFIRKNVPATDYFLVEPTWMSGGLIANGMAYGLSYVAFNHYYYNQFERHYPNVLTWNGADRPLQYLRMIDANNETVFKSGKSIYLYSTPGRNAHIIADYIDREAARYGVTYGRDTIYKNSDNLNMVIRLSNTSDWVIMRDAQFGFERKVNNSLMSDDERFITEGEFQLDNVNFTNGYHSLLLNEKISRSPDFVIQNVNIGDYIEITVKRKMRNGENSGNIYLVAQNDGITDTLSSGIRVSAINEKWELLRLTAGIKKVPDNEKLSCFYETAGENPDYIDDLRIRHFSKGDPTGEEIILSEFP